MILSNLSPDRPLERNIYAHLCALETIRLRANASMAHASFQISTARFTADLVIVRGWGIVLCCN